VSDPPHQISLPAGERPFDFPDPEVEAFLGFLLNIGVVSDVTPELRREVELQLWLRRLCDETDSPGRERR
jgi:hypothetical protein